MTLNDDKSSMKKSSTKHISRRSQTNQNLAEYYQLPQLIDGLMLDYLNSI